MCSATSRALICLGLYIVLPGLAHGYHELDHLEPDDAPGFVPDTSLDPTQLKAIQESLTLPDEEQKQSKDNSVKSGAQKTNSSSMPDHAEDGGSYAPLDYQAPVETEPDEAPQSLPDQVLLRRQGSLIQGGGFTFTPLVEETQGNIEAISTDHEPGEISVATANMADAQTIAQFAEQNGFSLLRRRTLRHLNMVFSSFGPPRGLTATEAATQLQQAVPQVLVELNHIYHPLRDPGYARQSVAWHPERASCSQAVRIALIDSLVDQNHWALAEARIEQRSVLPAGVAPGADAHGTAVASILVGQDQQTERAGLLPQAHLVAINVFRQADKKRMDTTAEWLVLAIDEALGGDVSVINLSLGGPPNRILEHAIRTAWYRGIAVVSAAGNSGPGAPPVYPAAYPEVIAVTAVDAKRQVFDQANRGDYVELAAPGVYVWTASPQKRKGKYVTGTSYAAPFVTAALAALRHAHKTDTVQAVRARLADGAVDLGAAGRDPVYGFGLVQWGVQCAQASID